MNLWAVLLTGLFAGGLSCAAVQGGLLAGLVTRQRAPQPAVKKVRRGAHQAVNDAAQRPWRVRLADDLTPVGGFLAGKLVSHTLLGALLGALGGAVQLSVGLRTMMQVVAGLLIVVFGLAQLGVPGFRDFTITPPASWGRLVRGSARSGSLFAPAVLGLATVLIPCGITLSVEALALTSGSPWAGAATMAVFVIGTGPLFTALGYVARKAATVWRGRLAILTGLIVVVMGLYTLNGGLELMGSPLAASRLAASVGLAPAVDTAGIPKPAVTDGRQTVVVRARTGSYAPTDTAVQAGIPTTLIVRADNADGCIRAFVIRDKQWILPPDGDTRIDLGTLKPGTLLFTCGMGMYSGQLSIVDKAQVTP